MVYSLSKYARVPGRIVFAQIWFTLDWASDKHAPPTIIQFIRLETKVRLR